MVQHAAALGADAGAAAGRELHDDAGAVAADALLELGELVGFEVVDWSSLRTWTCTSAAPASNAACVDSTCSLTVIGTAGLFSLRGTDPVMATVMMQGWGPWLCIAAMYTLIRS